MESWWCEACYGLCPLDAHGRCSYCGSDSVASSEAFLPQTDTAGLGFQAAEIAETLSPHIQVPGMNIELDESRWASHK